ncbi:MAG: hypothetical protein R2844_14370 [Caldilineales bacterium]
MLVTAGLIKIGEFRAIQRIRRAEFVWALIAFGGLAAGYAGRYPGCGDYLLVDPDVCGQSPTDLSPGTQTGRKCFRSLDEHPNDDIFPGLLILRTEGFMHFASMPRINDRLQELIQLAQPAGSNPGMQRHPGY